ncbi:MotA/TolQ/ExbB proton channel family protein [Tritonibacter scottomollicae]|uniref:Outer membrane transport energization protein ExbB n=1 Tax=Tritonibacter scottomollicae TaxID=483013 RepID=A0A2T1AB28_TRISK|nr:MotA/TolQ/ExbB proton channel family protein [Tritonibacter scottomollicae]PRZ45784.1 outer membrane transport energization protein ExbB [Tritonibacter scottomollicae]
MKKSLVLTTFLLLPVLATAQTAAPDTPATQAPVPEVAIDMMAPAAPTSPDTPDTPITAETAPVTTSESPATDGASATPSTSEALPVARTNADDVSPAASEPASAQDLPSMARGAFDEAKTFLRDGGPSIWAIAALSVITLALILWKIWRLALIGAWSKGKARQAVAAYEAGDADRALTLVQGRRGVRSKVVAAALSAIKSMPDAHAREETARVAKRELGSARSGLGALELISTIAPLLGLLGTVMGMIAAFQALQAAGSKADPSMLAGGIWEALLTTAAGMAVAIPASAALTWFESVIDRIRRDVEDGATRLFVTEKPQTIRLAAE